MKNILTIFICSFVAVSLASAQPLNDECANATIVTLSPPFGCPAGGVGGTTEDATFSGIAPQCGTAGVLQDVWFTFNTEARPTLDLNLTYGTASGGLTLEAYFLCSDSVSVFCAPLTQDFQFTLTALPPFPVDFYLKVGSNPGVGAVPGTFEICVQKVFACDLMEVSANIDHESGPGGSDGAIDINVDLGIPPYSYLWSTGATTEDIFNLPAGMYSVTVTGDSCVKVLDSLVIIERPGNNICVDALPLTVQAFNDCNGNTTSGTTINASYSGMPPSCMGNGTYPDVWYTFNSGNVTDMLIILNRGTAHYATFELFSACGVANASLTPHCIEGTSNIFTTISGFPGIPADYYLRVWSSDTIGTGTFTICLSDALPPPDPCDLFQLAIVGTDVSEFGANDGSADLTVTGGSAPYTYNWSNGATTEDITGIGPGTYSVTVVSAENCADIATVNINSPSESPCDLFNGIFLSGIDASALGASDGKVTLTILGTAAAPITYQWSNGATSKDVAGLTAGIYSVTVISADSCVRQGSISINQPGVAQCTPNLSNTQPGFSPALLPCIEQGVFFEQTVQFKNLDSIDANLVGFPGTILPVISTEITGLLNLPFGINFRCDNYPTCDYNGGESGCFLVSGTSYDNAGEYTLFWSGSITVLSGGGQVTVGVDSQLLVSTGLTYQLTVMNFGDTCAYVPSCITQNIPLDLGWNMVSSYIIPDEANMLNIISNISSDILLVKNGQGQATIPAFGIDGIGNWQVTEGYKIKTSVSTTLSLGCQQVDPVTTVVALPVGWSIAAYLRDSPMDLAAAVSSVASDILLVKNNLGNTYIPAFGINTIGDMIPGQGYKFKMSNAANLTYPANLKTSVGGSYRAVKNPAFYRLSINTGTNATIVVPVGSVSQILSIGDEIGVFSHQGKLVGSAVYEGYNLAITVWGNENEMEYEMEGMMHGEEFNYRIWRAANQQELEMTPAYEEGSEFYTDDGYSVLKRLKIENVPEKGFYVNSFPNPTGGKIYFDVRIGEESSLRLTVFNVLGKKMTEVTGMSNNNGIYNTGFDTRGLADGRYLYRVEANGQIFHGSFIITR